MNARSGCFLASSAIRASLVETLPEFRDSDIVPSFDSMNWPPLPSFGSSWREFPAVVGTTSGSDFSAPIALRFVSFARRYHCVHILFVFLTAPERSMCIASGPRAWLRFARCSALRVEVARSPRFLSRPRVRALLSRPRWSLRAHDPRAPRCCLPPSTRRRPPRLASFRGSITRPARSLSTLRSRPHGSSTQDSLPSDDQSLTGGLSSRRTRSEVSSMGHRLIASPSPGFSWRT